MNNITWYWKEISRFPKLTDEETAVLFQRMKDGDEAAFVKLTECNLRYVFWIYFNALHGSTKNAMDCIQAGNLALMRAIKSFDPNKDVAFGYYAFFIIRRAIIRECYKLDDFVHKPEREYYKAVNYKKKTLYSGVSDDLSSEEIANLISVPVVEIDAMKKMLSDLKPVPEQSKKRSDPESKERLETTNKISTEQSKIEEEKRWEKMIVDEALKSLSQKEREIVEMYYGFNGKIPMQMRDVASKKGMTFQNVSLIIKRAKEKLRKELSDE